MSDAPAPAPPRRGHPAFWALWGFDVLIAAVVVFFFLWGLADGTVSAFNIGLWLAMLAVVAAVVGGGYLMYQAGQTIFATIVLLVLAFPGSMFALFMLALIVLQPDFR